MTIYKAAFFILLIALVIAISNKDKFITLYQNFFSALPKVEQIIEERINQEIKKRVNTPPPLRAKEESPDSFLTVEGTITFTNKHRVQYDLSTLLNNPLLNQSATQKAKDMFEKQYFAHDSPDGMSVGDLAEDVGYEYITIGENLAMGNFLNDEVLIQGWMDSPGHRENILNSRYREIGIAVVRGIYEGRSTWIAVQHFGFPLSACPSPDGSLEQRIDNNTKKLTGLKRELDAKKEELDNTRPKGSPEYNEKVDEYNSLVEQYNQLAEETKGSIAEFNTQVENFNKCAS